MWRTAQLFALLRTEGKVILAMLRDPRAPKLSKLVAILALLYVISPVDFVSDLIPVLGWVDDGVIALLLLKLAIHFLPSDLQTSLRNQVELRQRGNAGRKSRKSGFNNADQPGQRP